MAEYSKALSGKIKSSEAFLKKYLGDDGFEKISDPSQYHDDIYFEGGSKGNPGGSLYFFAKKSLNKLRDLAGLGKDADLDTLHSDLKPKIIDVYNIFKLARRESNILRKGDAPNEASEVIAAKLEEANKLGKEAGSLKAARQLLVRLSLKSRSADDTKAAQKGLKPIFNGLVKSESSSANDLIHALDPVISKLKGDSRDAVSKLINFAYDGGEVPKDDLVAAMNTAAEGLASSAKEIGEEYTKASNEATDTLKEMGDQGKLERVSIPDITNKVQDSALLRKFIDISKTFAPLGKKTVIDKESLGGSLFKSSTDPEKAFDRMWARLYGDNKKHRESLSPDIRKQMTALDNFFENLYVITKGMDEKIEKAKTLLNSLPAPKVDLSATAALKKSFDRANKIFGDSLLDQYKADFAGDDDAEALQEFGRKVLVMLMKVDPVTLIPSTNYRSGSELPFHIPEFLSKHEASLKNIIGRLSDNIKTSLSKLDKEKENVRESYLSSVDVLEDVNNIFNAGYVKNNPGSMKEHDNKAIGESIRATRNFYSNTISKYPQFRAIVDNHSHMYGKYFEDEPSPKADRLKSLRSKQAATKSPDDMVNDIENLLGKGEGKLEKAEEGLVGNAVYDMMIKYHDKIKSLIEAEEGGEVNVKSQNSLAKFISGKVDLSDFDEFFKILTNLTTFASSDPEKFTKALDGAFNSIVHEYIPEAIHEEISLSRDYAKYKTDDQDDKDEGPKVVKKVDSIDFKDHLDPGRGVYDLDSYKKSIMKALKESDSGLEDIKKLNPGFKASDRARMDSYIEREDGLAHAEKKDLKKMRSTAEVQDFFEEVTSIDADSLRKAKELASKEELSADESKELKDLTEGNLLKDVVAKPTKKEAGESVSSMMRTASSILESRHLLPDRIVVACLRSLAARIKKADESAQPAMSPALRRKLERSEKKEQLTSEPYTKKWYKSLNSHVDGIIAGATKLLTPFIKEDKGVDMKEFHKVFSATDYGSNEEREKEKFKEVEVGHTPGRFVREDAPEESTAKKAAEEPQLDPSGMSLSELLFGSHIPESASINMVKELRAVKNGLVSVTDNISHEIRQGDAKRVIKAIVSLAKAVRKYKIKGNYFERGSHGEHADIQELEDLIDSTNDHKKKDHDAIKRNIDTALEDNPEMYDRAEEILDKDIDSRRELIDDLKEKEQTPTTKSRISKLRSSVKKLTDLKKSIIKDPHSNTMEAFKLVDKTDGAGHKKYLAEANEQESRSIENHVKSSKELLDNYLRYRNPNGFDPKYFESIADSKALKGDVVKAIRMIDGHSQDKDSASDEQKDKHNKTIDSVKKIEDKAKKAYPNLFDADEHDVAGKLFTDSDAKKLDSLKETIFKTERRILVEKEKGDEGDKAYISKKEKDVLKKHDALEHLNNRSALKEKLVDALHTHGKSSIENPTPKSSLSKKLHDLIKGSTHLGAADAHALVLEVSGNSEISEGLKKSVEAYIEGNSGAGDDEAIKAAVEKLADDGAVSDMIEDVKSVLKGSDPKLLEGFSELVESGKKLSTGVKANILSEFGKNIGPASKDKHEGSRSSKHTEALDSVSKFKALREKLQGVEDGIKTLKVEQVAKTLKKNTDKHTKEFLDHIEDEVKSINDLKDSHLKTIKESEKGEHDLSDSDIGKIQEGVEALQSEQESLRKDLEDYKSDKIKLIRDAKDWHSSEYIKHRDRRLHEEANPTGESVEDSKKAISGHRDSEKKHFKGTETLRHSLNSEKSSKAVKKYDVNHVGDLDIAESGKHQGDNQGSQFLSKSMRVPLKRGAFKDSAINIFDPSTNDQVFMHKWSQMSMDKVKSGGYPTPDDFEGLVDTVYGGYLDHNMKREFSAKGLETKVKDEKEKNDHWKELKGKYQELSSNIERDIPPVLKAMGKAYREVQNEMEDVADNMDQYSKKMDELAESRKQDEPEVGITKDVDYEELEKLLRKSEDGTITETEHASLDKIIKHTEAKGALKKLIERHERNDNIKDDELASLKKNTENAKEAGGSDDSGLMGDIDRTQEVTESYPGQHASREEMDEDEHAERKHLRSNPSLRQQMKAVKFLKTHFKKLQAGKGELARVEKEKKTQYTHAQDYAKTDTPEVKELTSSVQDLNKLIKAFKFDDRFRSGDAEQDFSSDALDRSHKKTQELKGLKDQYGADHGKLDGQIETEYNNRQNMIKGLHDGEEDVNALMSEMIDERDRILEKSKAVINIGDGKVTYGQLGEAISSMLDVYLELRAKVRSTIALADKEIGRTGDRLSEFEQMKERAGEDGIGLNDDEQHNYKNIYLNNMWKRIEHIWLSNASAFEAQYNLNYDDWKNMFSLAKEKFGVLGSPRLSNMIKFISEVIEGQNSVRFGPTRASSGRSNPDMTADELLDPNHIKELKSQKDEIYKLMYAFEAAEFARASIEDLVKKGKGDTTTTKSSTNKKSFMKRLSKLEAELGKSMSSVKPEIKKSIETGAFEVSGGSKTPEAPSNAPEKPEKPEGALKQADVYSDPDFNPSILYGKKMQAFIANSLKNN